MSQTNQKQKLKDQPQPNNQGSIKEDSIKIEEDEHIRASKILSQLSNNQNQNQQILEEEQSLIQQIENYYGKLAQIQDRQNGQRQYLQNQLQLLKLEQGYFMRIQEYIDIDKLIQHLKSSRQKHLNKVEQENQNKNIKMEQQQKIKINPELRKEIIQTKLKQFKRNHQQNFINQPNNQTTIKLLLQAGNLQQLNNIYESIFNKKLAFKIKEQQIEQEIKLDKQNQVEQKRTKVKVRVINNPPLYEIQKQRLNQMNKIKKQMYFILQQNQFQIFNRQQQNRILDNFYFRNLLKNQRNKVNFRYGSFRQKNLDDLQIEIINKTFDWEIVQIYCKYHNYGKKFTVLNQLGYINNFKQLDQNYVIKKLQWNQIQRNYYRRESQKSKLSTQLFQSLIRQNLSIRKAIEHFFILNMMSSLKLGTYLPKINGFDLIVDSQYVFFSMQKCEQIRTKMYKDIAQLQKIQIFENMLKMHSLNICHIDIQPYNIIFSKKYQKPIFIFNNYVQMVKQSIYQKSYVNMNTRTGYYANLYINDIESIIKSFTHMPPRDRLQKSKQLNVFMNYQQQSQQMRIISFQEHYNFIITSIITYMNQQKDKTEQPKQRCLIIKTLKITNQEPIYSTFLEVYHLLTGRKKSQGIECFYEMDNVLYCQNLTEQGNSNRHTYKKAYLTFINRARQFVQKFSLFHKLTKQGSINDNKNDCLDSQIQNLRTLVNIRENNTPLYNYLDYLHLLSQNKIGKQHQNYQDAALFNKIYSIFNKQQYLSQPSLLRKQKDINISKEYNRVQISHFLDNTLGRSQVIENRYFTKNSKNQEQNYFKKLQSPQKQVTLSLYEQFPNLCKYFQIILDFTSLQKQHISSYEKQKRNKALQNFNKIALKYDIQDRCLKQLKNTFHIESQRLKQSKPGKNSINQDYYHYVEAFWTIFIYMYNEINKIIHDKNTLKQQTNKITQPNDSKAEQSSSQVNHIKTSNNKFLVKFIQKHMFHILKNLIILGFNYHIFIKQYLKSCIIFILKDKTLRNKFLLIFIKQIIQIGLLLKYVYKVHNLPDYKNLINLHCLSNQSILKFEFKELFDHQMQFKQFQQIELTIKKISVIQKLWIFVSPVEQITLFESKCNIKNYLKKVQLSLNHQLRYDSLNNIYHLSKISQYFDLLAILKDYEKNFLKQSLTNPGSSFYSQYQRHLISLSKNDSPNSTQPKKSYYILAKNHQINASLLLNNAQQKIQPEQIQSIDHQYMEQTQLLNQLFLQVTQNNRSQDGYKLFYMKLDRLKEQNFGKYNYFNLTQPRYLNHLCYKNKINNTGFYKLLNKSLQKLDSIIGQQKISNLIHLDLRLQCVFHLNEVDKIKTYLTQYNIMDLIVENFACNIQLSTKLTKTIYLNSCLHSDVQLTNIFKTWFHAYSKQRNKALQYILKNITQHYKQSSQNQQNELQKKYMYTKIVLLQNFINQQKQISRVRQVIRDKNLQYAKQIYVKQSGITVENHDQEQFQLQKGQQQQIKIQQYVLKQDKTKINIKNQQFEQNLDIHYIQLNKKILNAFAINTQNNHSTPSKPRKINSMIKNITTESQLIFNKSQLYFNHTLVINNYQQSKNDKIESNNKKNLFLQTRIAEYQRYLQTTFNKNKSFQQQQQNNSQQYFQLDKQYFETFVVRYIIYLCKQMYSYITNLSLNHQIHQNHNYYHCLLQHNYCKLKQLLKFPYFLKQNLLEIIFYTLLNISRIEGNQQLNLFKQISFILKSIQLSSFYQINVLLLSEKYVIKEFIKDLSEWEDGGFVRGQQEDKKIKNKLDNCKILLKKYTSIVSQSIQKDKNDNLFNESYDIKQNKQMSFQLSCMTYLYQRYKFMNKPMGNVQLSKLFTLLRKIIYHMGVDSVNNCVVPNNFVNSAIKGFLQAQQLFQNNNQVLLQIKSQSQLSTFDLVQEKMKKKKQRYFELQIGENM